MPFHLDIFENYNLTMQLTLPLDEVLGFALHNLFV